MRNAREHFTGVRPDLLCASFDEMFPSPLFADRKGGYNVSMKTVTVGHDASAEREHSLPARSPRIRRIRLMLVRLSFLLPLILYLLIFYGYPLFYSLQISLEKYDLQAEITGVTSFIGVSNYVADFQDPTFKLAALHTMMFTVFSIVPQFLIGLALA